MSFAAGAARPDLGRYRAAGDARHLGQDRAHRQAGAGAEIARHAGAAGLQITQRRDVGGGEIGDMDIVADTGAIRGRVIGAENLQGRMGAEHGADRERDQMGLGIVILAQLAVVG